MRKILTAVLCLLLTVMLPLSSMAATEYTFSVKLGDELASIAGIKDLMDALSLRVLCGEKSGGMTLALGDADALSIALRGDADGLYIQSAALGEAPLYFSKEDVKAFLTSVVEQAEDMSPEESAAAKQGLDQIFRALDMMSGSDAPAAEAPELTLEQLTAMMADDTAMTQFITDITAATKVTDGEYTDAAHDPATRMTEITITSADLAKLADSKIVQTLLAQEAGKEITAEEALTEFKKMMETIDIVIPVTAYTADEGKTLVSLQAPITIKGTITTTKTDEDGETETETEKIDVAENMTYNRLTVDGVVNHSGKIVLTEENEEKATISASLQVKDNSEYTFKGVIGMVEDGVSKDALTAEGVLTMKDEAFTGWLGMMTEGVQFTMSAEGKPTADGSEKTIDIYVRSDAASVIAPSASDRPLVTLKAAVNQKAGEDALAAVKAATPEASTQLLTMTAEEQETAIQAIGVSAMQSLYTIMGMLPASTIQMFVGTEDSGTIQK